MALVALGATSLAAQHGARMGEWRAWAGDTGATRYAPLDQIDAQNFGTLEVAWRFKTDNLGPRPDFNLQTTPLMVNGVLYFTAGSHRNAVAVNAATGEMLWVHRLEEGRRAELSSRRMSGRGVGYWTDGQGDERIFYVSSGYQLVGLDAKTGRPLRDFGRDGVIDLRQDNDQQLDLVNADISWNGAPVVARNVIIVGASHRAGSAPRSKENPKGYIRGFDARTGKRLWIFHTIPRPGEFGNDTWLDDSWSYTGHTGVWTQMTVDEELGIAYLPVEIPTGDYFGGHRPGNNLFAESLVALELETGKRLWHFQFVHHPIWDYDVPCAPILADITVNGRQIKAVAQPTKQGLLYVFDRVTGQPVWPIEERPVEKGTLPSETYSPTQPIPTKPPPFERGGFLEDYVIDFTPELKAEALKVLSQYKYGPLFTPPIARGEGGKVGTLYIPNGANWPGGSLDPDTGMLYVYSHTLLRVLSMVNDPKRSDMNYISVGGGDDSGAGPDRPGTAAGQAAVGPHHRHRSQQGRDRLADRARRDAGYRAQSPGAQRPAHSQDRSSRRGGRELGRHRHPDHEDARDLRRGRRVHRPERAARGHASCLRQGDRPGGGRSLHAGRPDRITDDVHAERQAIHRGRRQRGNHAGRADRLRASRPVATRQSGGIRT